MLAANRRSCEALTSKQLCYRIVAIAGRAANNLSGKN